MCGIFAAINGHSVTNNLIAGLEALSYRGYDSAGIAVVSRQGLERRRAKGKLENLEKRLQSEPVDGTIGIAHTRWATHGAPTRQNAHPHMTPQVAVAHNGIIENYQALQEDLDGDGYLFQSETDSEVIPLLITRNLDQGMKHEQAMREALNHLEGCFAVAAVFHDRPDMMLAARRGSPLILGQAEGGYYLSSDVNALTAKADMICHMEEGDLACVQRDHMSIIDVDGNAVERPLQRIEAAAADCSKQGYRHYMLKEIHEQPEVLKRTMAQFLATKRPRARLAAMPSALENLQRLSIIACGTSYYAGMIGKYWLEGFSALPTDIDIASESRYRNAPLSCDTAALFISQSGETADTLAALRHARAAGQGCISIVNVANSSMAHESDSLLNTLAGQEIGVASTKAFTAQLGVLLNLALTVARANNRIDAHEEERLLTQIQRLPGIMQRTLQDLEEPVRKIAAVLQHAGSVLYLGRGIGYPLAQEGALKLKEISYIHAEAYPAGELKHGPIALVDDQMPVVMIAPPGPLFGKTFSNLREVASRGARIVLISNREGVDAAGDHIEDAIVMPDVEELLQPILYALPLQLLAYHIAVLKGTDVDQPRNLAKSVTVE
ncbi:MAG: glutamine--fructose-6-phosphate transaminase (isomerizing) [Gammaproteobacteria bacterium]|nr:glutamine--fructose-6-phosphate transaminase (isomerizing) [Gammaproteobacteria bacterium]